MEIHKVYYSKHFLTGLLAGMTVKCSFNTPKDTCAEHQNRLNQFTRDEPAEDYGTHDKFWVYNVGCSEVQAQTLDRSEHKPSDHEANLSD